ncbi:MAG: hypothetical protein WCP70_06445 [Methanothrix sp.]
MDIAYLSHFGKGDPLYPQLLSARAATRVLLAPVSERQQPGREVEHLMANPSPKYLQLLPCE